MQPDATGVLADRLDDALSRLPALGITVRPASRLPQAVRLLRAIHASGAYPVTQPELIRVGNAIKAAFNFIQIIDVLRAAPPGAMESLRRALKGTLDDVGATAPHRAQSELFFGVTLVAGGARTGAPRQGRRKTPDFVADVDTAAYSVEVKRPSSAGAVKAKVAEAARQMRAYKDYPSVVALDFSDLLPAPFGIRDMRAAEATYQGPFRAAYTTARDHVIARASQPGYSRLAVLPCFAESFLWTVPNPHPLPHAALMLYAEVFPAAYAGLVSDQSDKLRSRIFEGFRELGGRIRQLVIPP